MGFKIIWMHPKGHAVVFREVAECGDVVPSSNLERIMVRARQSECAESIGIGDEHRVLDDTRALRRTDIDKVLTCLVCNVPVDRALFDKVWRVLFAEATPSFAQTTPIAAGRIGSVSPDYAGPGLHLRLGDLDAVIAPRRRVISNAS